MATTRSEDVACRFVKEMTMELETEAGRKPFYNGVVVTDDTLLVIDRNARNFQLYSHDGKLLYTSHRLEDIPMDVCVISKMEVAVCLVNSKILILSLKSVDDVKLVKTLDVMTGFDGCHSVAKLNSDKLVVSGVKWDKLYWCVVNLTDGRVDSTHYICKGDILSPTHLAIKHNTVYISCWTSDSNGVYAYDIFNPHTHKFLYQHHRWRPGSVMADERNFIYVIDFHSKNIHQLTDSGQLVTINTVSSSLDKIFYDDQHGVLYTTRVGSNVITVYRLEYLHQPGVPVEILNMDHRSIQLFQEALKDGKETVHSIRVMVVGHIGVGKTTLVKRLLGREVNISERCSTEGIDVYVNCCDVSLSTCEWTTRGKDSEQDYQLQRLARVLNEQQSVKDKVTAEEQLIIPPQGEIIVKSHEEDRVAVENKNTELPYRHSPQQDIDQDLSSTASQQGEFLPTLVQRKLTQSENNTLAMLKLLHDNAYKLKQDTANTSPLTVLDFAGQFAFYTTHQTFLTRRAIYLLVSDVSEQLTDLVADECFFDSEGMMKCKVHDLLEVWLNLIHFCATSTEVGIPPVILVGTHVDQILQKQSSKKRMQSDGQTTLFTTSTLAATAMKEVPRAPTFFGSVDKSFKPSRKKQRVEGIPDSSMIASAKLGQYGTTSQDGGLKSIPPSLSQRYGNEICERYFRAIRTYLSDKPTRFHLIGEDFAIDNTVVDSKLKDLKRKIVEVAKQQPYWGEQILARWILLEQELMRLKAAGIKVLPRSVMDELNKACAVPIVTDELDLFLRFHHDIGTILYFSIDILKEKIVLDPQLMIDALKSLITAEMFVLRSNLAVTDKWFEFKNKGKLSQELIEDVSMRRLDLPIFVSFEDTVWTKQKHPDFHDNKEHILLLMEQLNIIAKLRLYNEEASEIKNENCFLAPCMLSQKTPREVIYPVPQPQIGSSSVICYVFVGKYLPSPIFHRLLAACVAYWPIATRINNGALENLIFCGGCVFQLDHYHKLTIHFRDYIIYMRVTRKGIKDRTPSSKLCIEVREFVSAMLTKIIGCLGQSLKFEYFIQCPEYSGDSIYCLIPVSLLQENTEVCCACHDNITESNKLLQFWFIDKEQSGDSDLRSSLPLNMQDKKPSERQLVRLSMKIGQISLPLGAELGLTWEDVSEIQKDYSHAVTQCLMILVKWQLQSKDRATFKNLELAFQHVGIDVDILKSIDTGEPTENGENIVSCLPSNLQDKKLSERQLGRLSMKIGQKFLLLGLELGLSWMDIQQIQNKYPHIATQCLVSLVKWKQENEDRATFKTLEKAFQLIDIDVDILKSISTAVSLMPLHLKDKKLTEGQLDELSKKIEQEFLLLLALELELSWVDIQQIEHDYSHTPIECCRAILVKWQQQSYDRATFQSLEKAFQLVGIDVNILKFIVTGIPLEILNMDFNSIQLFKEALKAGKERVFNIRVMVVGQFGVGKTTLVKRLLGETVNISDRCSTDGIDVHVHCCDVSLTTKEWTRQNKDSEQYSRLKRFVKLFDEHVQKPKVRGQQEGQSRMAKNQDGVHHTDNSVRHVISQLAPSTTEIKKPDPLPPMQQIQLSSDKVDERPVVDSGQKEISVEIPLSDAKSDKREILQEILQLINVNFDKIENSIVEHASLAIWDFAGQYIFYTTHQTFLTSRAIYLLVVDLSQEVTDFIKDDECFIDTEGIKMCKVHDLIEIWLNSIHSCAPCTQAGITPVILVGTHVDKIPEKSRQKVIYEYFMKIRQILKNKPIVLHLMDNIEIDNNQCDPRLEDLKRRIVELASQQPYWGEEKPARWLPLEQAIMTLKASGVKVAPLSLIEEINMSGSVRIEDRDELDLFLRVQHEIGTILYFSVDGLREKIVLDPQWMIDALKSLITAEMFITKNPTITALWFKLKEEGKLTHELIDAVWSKQLNPEFHANKDLLLLLMEKLNIIARPISYSEDGKEDKVNDYFLCPCMLRQETPIEVIFPKQNPQMESSSVLCFVFIERFLPPSIFHRLLAACLAHWPIYEKKQKNQIFCGSCVFQLDPCHKLILHFKEYIIFARVTKMSKKDKTPDLKLCIRVREFINSNLSKIIGCMCHNLKFELYIQCLESEANCSDSIFPVSELQNKEEGICSSHDTDHVVVSQDLLKFWFAEKGSEGEKVQDTGYITKLNRNSPGQGLTSHQHNGSKRTPDPDKKGQKRQLSDQDRRAAEGTPRSTRTDRTDKKIEAREKHNQLRVTLDELITEDALQNIKIMADTYLGPKTVEKIKNMDNLFSSLEVKGKISVGKYDTLIKIMTLAGVEVGKDEIQNTARDINDIMQHYIPSQEQSEMSSLEAHTSNQDSISMRPGKKRKPVSVSPSDSSSDSNSESDESSYSESEMASHQYKRKEKRKKYKKQKLKKKRKRRWYSSKYSDAGDQ